MTPEITDLKVKSRYYDEGVSKAYPSTLNGQDGLQHYCYFTLSHSEMNIE
jgi:hypothetical protein